MDRRRFLTLVTAAGAAACAAPASLSPASAPAARTADDLDAIADRIMSGGPPPDGIPPIETPQYVSAAEGARQWKDDAVVDAVVLDGRPRAYPRIVTVWHEIVNETSAAKPVAITYCPLTGSAVAFSGVLPDGRATTFGTSGKLYNSNLVMYDRATNSLWPQLLGIAVRGERKSDRLAELAILVTTTLGRWRARYPDTVVLSKETGHVRAYGSSPYGDYDTSGGVMFPVTSTDDRFHPKKVVVGVRVGEEALAIPKDELRARKVASTDLGGRPIVALYDSDLDVVRAFSRATSKGELRFAVRGTDVVDEQTGSRWSPEGRALSGELAGAELDRVNAYDVMWFAWSAFRPRTKVLD